jgi:hypothetical protein
MTGAVPRVPWRAAGPLLHIRRADRVMVTIAQLVRPGELT